MRVVTDPAYTYTYSWTEAGSRLDLKDVKVVASATNGPLLVLRPNVLVPGSTYTIRVTMTRALTGSHHAALLRVCDAFDHVVFLHPSPQHTGVHAELLNYLMRVCRFNRHGDGLRGSPAASRGASCLLTPLHHTGHGIRAFGHIHHRVCGLRDSDAQCTRTTSVPTCFEAQCDRHGPSRMEFVAALTCLPHSAPSRHLLPCHFSKTRMRRMRSLK
jgi:hypothetical protein